MANFCEEIQLEFAGIRIGTMRTYPVRINEDDIPPQTFPCIISEKGVKFKVTKISSSCDVDFQIKLAAKHIKCVDAYLLRGCPAIWITSDQQSAKKIRSICQMSTGSGVYYDPDSPVSAHHMISILPKVDPLPLQLTQSIQKLFERMGRRNGYKSHDFFQTITQTLCNTRLVAVSSYQAINHMDVRNSATSKKLFGATSKDSDWSDETSEEEEVQTVDDGSDTEIMLVPKKKDFLTSSRMSRDRSPNRQKDISERDSLSFASHPTTSSPPRKVHRARKSIPNKNREVSVESQLRARVESQPTLMAKPASNKEPEAGGSLGRQKQSDVEDEISAEPSTSYTGSTLGESTKRKAQRESNLWSVRSKKMKQSSSSGASSPRTDLQNGTNKYVDSPNDDGEAATTVNKAQEKQHAACRQVASLKQDLNNLMKTMPLCTCNVQTSHHVNLEMGINCMAVDNISGRLFGCHRRVTKSPMLRPSNKIPVLGLCDEHRERMIRHECCPGCGTFCCGGVILVCFNNENCPHRYHRDCMLLSGRNTECPHCGGSCNQVKEINLKPNDDKSLMWVKSSQSAEKLERRKYAESRGHSARMTCTVQSHLNPVTVPGVTVELPSGFSIETSSLFPGKQRDELTKLLESFKPESSSAKKSKVQSKSFLNSVINNDLAKVIQTLSDSEARHQDDDEESNLLTDALFEAVRNNHVSMTHLLLQCGADVNSKNVNGDTPLFEAIHQELNEMLFYLLLHKADVTLKDDEGMTCLHHAAKDGLLEACHLLLTYGRANVNTLDDGGWTPVVWAAEHDQTKIARYLVHQGANLHIVDKEGNICLQWASLSGNLEILQLCIEASSNVNHTNTHGDTSLHIAAREDNYPCVTALLGAEADPTIKNNDGQVSVDLAKHGSCSWVSLQMNSVIRQAAIVDKLVPFNFERVLSRDMSRGYDKVPIMCVNAVDDAPCPTDPPNGFHYVTENVHTSEDTKINAVISGIQSCGCSDNCKSSSCVCGLMSEKCWYSKDGTLLPDFDISEPPLVFECNKMCKCSRQCSNRVVQNGIRYRLQVYRTHGRGWGLRALESIPRGAFVCDYVGELVSDAEADVREDDSYLFDLENKDGEMFCIDARSYGNVSRFINHLCEPNLIPIRVFVDHHDIRFPKLAYFTTRDIQAYEELGFDYGDRFWDVKCRQFTCMCRSPRCKYSEEVYKRKAEEEKAKKVEEEEEGEVEEEKSSDVLEDTDAKEENV